MSKPESLQHRVSAEEWQLRVDLAAAYRLVALYGWDDLVFTHLTVRVPGPEHRLDHGDSLVVAGTVESVERFAGLR